jgi:ADP-ribose pyrophosphatase YjhB (NUDIX family)
MGEETSINVEPIRLLTVLDSITRDEEGRIRFHCVLPELQCEELGGELETSSESATPSGFTGGPWVLRR